MSPFQGVKPAQIDPKYARAKIREILLDRIIQLYLTQQTSVAPTDQHLKNIIGNRDDCDPVGDVIARLESAGVDLSDLLSTSTD